MANHGKKPSQRSKAYWSRHYTKPSVETRLAKRAKARAEAAK